MAKNFGIKNETGLPVNQFEKIAAQDAEKKEVMEMEMDEREKKFSEFLAEMKTKLNSDMIEMLQAERKRAWLASAKLKDEIQEIDKKLRHIHADLKYSIGSLERAVSDLRETVSKIERPF